MSEVEMRKGVQAEKLLESMEKYFPERDVEERRKRLMRLIDRLLDEKALEFLHRKYQGKSWYGLRDLMADLENLPKWQKEERARVVDKQVNELKRQKVKGGEATQAA